MQWTLCHCISDLRLTRSTELLSFSSQAQVCQWIPADVLPLAIASHYARIKPQAGSALTASIG